MNFLTMRRDDDHVILILGKTPIIRWHYRQGLEFVEILRSVCKQIENDQNPQQQALDQAILRRAGMPVGLSDNPKVQELAHQEAQWNRDLRRYMPGAPGIPSRERFGTPTVQSEVST